jgi:hypothetical protein
MKLTTPDGKELEYVAKAAIDAQGIINSANLSQLDDNPGPEVPVVNKFLDVSPEELSVVPPDRDIEFVIELVFGTAPI